VKFCSGRRAAYEIQMVAADTAASTVWVEIQKRMDRRATVFAADPTNLSPKLRFPLPNRFMQDIAIQFQRLPNKPT
jgi:hypothetical protein